MHPRAAASSRRSLNRGEQKPVSLMIHLLSKFCSLRETVPDFDLSTESATNACLLVPEHFKLLGCNAHNRCLSKAIYFILQLFVRQMPNVDSYTNEPMEIQKAVRRFLQENTCAVESRQKYELRAPLGLSVVHAHPPPHHFVFMLLQYIDDKNLFYH